MSLTSLADIKAWLFEPSRFAKGASCPCCAQFVKVYKRGFNRTMGRAIIWIANQERGQWVDVARATPKELKSFRDWDKLMFWGLVERRSSDTAAKRASGYWRATALGLRFAEGKHRIPKYVKVYNGAWQGFEGVSVAITDIVDGFDYGKLMRGE